MRVNDKEIKQLAKQRPTQQGTLQYLKPQGQDWSDWYQPPVYKERVFKLIHNCLFYYRPNELEDPLGVFVLEQMEVAYESPGPAFAFSLTSNDGKHIFACRCQEDLNKWVSALKVASYTYWKSLHEVLQCKLARLKGTPWPSSANRLINVKHTKLSGEQNVKSMFYTTEQEQETRNDNDDLNHISQKMSKSTFYSETTSGEMTTVRRIQERISSARTVQSTQNIQNVAVGNLIDL